MELKLKGNPKWFFAATDEESRFWIAKQMCDKKKGIRRDKTAVPRGARDSGKGSLRLR
jgi:hypothetical protein